uniref:Fibrinogen C-terminal domain-containing protein n=1 Tax=Romanomermis culicivorax TaxID=13658 RepID=A0A915JNW3_ROMCU
MYEIETLKSQRILDDRNIAYLTDQNGRLQSLVDQHLNLHKSDMQILEDNIRQNFTKLEGNLHVRLLGGESIGKTFYLIGNSTLNANDTNFIEKMSQNMLRISNLLNSVNESVFRLSDRYAWYSFLVEHLGDEIYVIKEELKYSSRNSENHRKELSNVRFKINDANSNIIQLFDKMEYLATNLHNLYAKFNGEMSYNMILVNLTDLVVQIGEDQSKLFAKISHEMENIRNKITEDEQKLLKTSNLSQNVKTQLNSHFSAMQTMKQQNLEFDHRINTLSLKVAHLQTEFLNSSLNLMKESNNYLRQDAKLENFKSDILNLNSKIGAVQDTLKQTLLSLRQKADYRDLKKFTSNVENFGEKLQVVANFGQNLDEIKENIQILEQLLPNDCSFSNLPMKFGRLESGIYSIKPRNYSKSFAVYCSMIGKETEGEKWTIIQRRIDGSTDFNRTWSHYKHGFGNLERDFWLGNDKIYALTKQNTYQLKINLWDIYGDHYFALYDNFSLYDESRFYELRIASLTGGNLSDSLSLHNGHKFSTPDRDQDSSSTNCAKFYESGWWFNHCHTVNLNGRPNIGMIWFDNRTQDWIQLNGTIMQIRPTKL